jgi:hypothetical protein
MPSKKENSGCGCSSIPISFILVLLGIGYWGFTQIDRSKLNQFLTAAQQPATTTQPSIDPVLAPVPRQRVTVTTAPPPQNPAVRPTKPQASPVSATLKKTP